MSDLVNFIPSSGDVDVCDEHRRLVEEAIELSLSTETRRAYSRALRELQRWSEVHGYDWLSAAAISIYLAERIDAGYSRSQIGQTVSAVKRWCLEHRQLDVTQDAGLQLVVRGLRRKVRGKQVRRAHPLTVDELARLCASIDTSTNRGRRDVAILLLGFGSGQRRSTISQLDRGDAEIRKSGIRLSIRFSKTDQLGAGETLVVARGSKELTDPVRAVTRYLAARGSVDANAPLFVGVTNGDRFTEERLSGGSISRIIQRRASAAGMEISDLSGHSLRAGAATTLAENHVPVDRIAKLTLSKSLDTLNAVYVRPAEAWNDPVSGDLGL